MNYGEIIFCEIMYILCTFLELEDLFFGSRIALRTMRRRRRSVAGEEGVEDGGSDEEETGGGRGRR